MSARTRAARAPGTRPAGARRNAHVAGDLLEQPWHRTAAWRWTCRRRQHFMVYQPVATGLSPPSQSALVATSGVAEVRHLARSPVHDRRAGQSIRAVMVAPMRPAAGDPVPTCPRPDPIGQEPNRATLLPKGSEHRLSLSSNGATAAGSRSSSVLARPAAARCRLRQRRARHAGHGEAGGAPAHERSRAVLATAGRRSAAPCLLRGRPRDVSSQVPELRQRKIGITPFDCPCDMRGAGSSAAGGRS